MALLIKCLMCKHEDLSSGPLHPSVAHISNSGSRTGVSVGHIISLSSQTGELLIQLETSVSKNKLELAGFDRVHL